MLIRKSKRGSSGELVTALNNRIQELDGSSVESSGELYDEEMDVEGCNTGDGSVYGESIDLGDTDEEVLGGNSNYLGSDGERSTDTDAIKQYVDNIQFGVRSELETEVDSIAFRSDEINMYVTVVYMDNVREYEVPYEDLTFDESKVDEDVSYIVNTVLEDLDTME